jgi:hypothetical protein
MTPELTYRELEKLAGSTPGLRSKARAFSTTCFGRMIIRASLSVKCGQNKKGEAISDFPLFG